MLPQVVVLIAAGPFVNPFVQQVGFTRAAWLGAAAIVVGLVLYTALNRVGYVWVAIALALVAAGLRISGVVAAVNVLRGLPAERTSIGAALTDTATEVSSGAGLAVCGTLLAALFAGSIATTGWSPAQTAEFGGAVTLAGLVLTVVAAVLVGWAMLRTRHTADEPATPVADVVNG